MLPRVTISSLRKTPVLTHWWLDYDGTKLGPFAAERDACRRAADMIDVAWQAESFKGEGRVPRVWSWQEMVRWFGGTDDIARLSTLVGACRAARDAILLSIASTGWSEQAVADALSHAGQWLAPIIGASQDVVAGPIMRLTAEESVDELRCHMGDRYFYLTMRGGDENDPRSL